MRASEEFYRAAANTPQITNSPYALYHQALDRSTERRQRLQEQQGAIAAHNSEEAWKNIASIPTNAVKGYQTGQQIKGEKQRQMIAEEQNARARAAHDLSMESADMDMRRRRAEFDYDMSPTEEGQARWQSDRERDRELKTRQAEAAIASQESQNRFNEFQTGHMQRQEEAQRIAGIKARAEGLIAEAARMPETVDGGVGFREDGSYGKITIPNPDRQRLLADAESLMQQAYGGGSDVQASLSRGQREARDEASVRAANNALVDRQKYGVAETEQRGTQIRQKSAALIRYAEAVQEYQAARQGIAGTTSQSETNALNKAISALAEVNPTRAMQLKQSADRGLFGRYGIEQGSRGDFMSEILNEEMANLEQDAVTLRQTGVFPDTGSLNNLPAAIDADIQRLHAVAQSKSNPRMGKTQPPPPGMGGNSGLIPAGAGGNSMRNRVVAPPPAGGVAQPPVYNQQQMLDNMWGPT